MPRQGRKPAARRRTREEDAQMALKAVLLDLGGVVYQGGDALPGAVEAISRLREAGLALRFLTNTTRKPKRQVLEKLRGLGVEAETEELFTPAMAARARLEREGLGAHLLAKAALEEDFEGLLADNGNGAGGALVVADAGDDFTFEALNEAFRVLMDDGEAPFLALAKNRRFMDDDGRPSMDAGAFVAALEYASEREAEVLGKPAEGFFRAALESIGAEPAEAAMVGDDAEADVGGAMAAGLTGVLVRTGKYRDGDEDSLEPRPDRVADDLAAAVDWLLKQM